MVETGRRSYRSPLREEQARATRRTIVEAARELFIEVGYASTTIDAVAARAGVSRKTVFSSVGGKPMLLKLAWDWALAGDDEPVPIVDRPIIARMQAEQDPVRLVDIWTRFQAEIGGRLSRIHVALLAAADTDDDVRALQQETEVHRLAGCASFIAHLAEIGGLRTGLTEQRATEIAATLLDPEPHRRLVLDAGWDFDEYAEWLQRITRASLLDD